MRKLVVCNIMSLDGYYTGPGDDVMVMPMRRGLRRLQRRTPPRRRHAAGGSPQLPGVQGVLAAAGRRPRRRPVLQEIGRRNNAIEKVVVSDTLTADDTDPWRSTTRIVRRADAHDQVAELKRQPGREILTFGSRTLWNDLLAHDLVDELHLILGAAVLGAGTPIFGAKPPGRLRLAEVRRFDGSDNLVVRYRLGPDAG